MILYVQNFCTEQKTVVHDNIKLPYLLQEAEAELNPGMQDSSYTPQRQTPTMATTECEEDR